MGWVERVRMVLNKFLYFLFKMRKKCEVYCYFFLIMMIVFLNFNEKNSKNYVDLIILFVFVIDCK